MAGEEDGTGPLLERDYWAVVAACPPPGELMDIICARFPEFAPPELVTFRPSRPEPLDVGDEMEVKIAAAGQFGVRVVHRDEHSITLATLPGHPEAGRITFGAYRNRRGDVVLHIRSRSRTSSASRLVGFLLAGDAMQTNTWTDFLNRAATAVGGGVTGAIHAEKREVQPEDGDRTVDRPTFIARDG